MRILGKIYQLLIYFGKFLQPFLLLVLRLFWGWQFFQAGLGKLGNISGVIEMFTSLGIPNATLFAYLIAWVEAIGGIFLFFGFLTRLTAIPLAIIMIVALATFHVEASMGILSNPGLFIEQTPVTYLMVSLVLLAFGPGLFSIDALFKRSLLDTPPPPPKPPV